MFQNLNPNQIIMHLISIFKFEVSFWKLYLYTNSSLVEKQKRKKNKKQSATRELNFMQIDLISLSHSNIFCQNLNQFRFLLCSRLKQTYLSLNNFVLGTLIQFLSTDLPLTLLNTFFTISILLIKVLKDYLSTK